MEVQRKRPSLFWPILLIALGAFLLLNNIGTLQDSGWDLLAKYWPLIFIVAGLDGIWRFESMAGSVVIIAFGTTFLLSNLGYITISAWDLFLRMWPVLIVAFGLDLIIGRRGRWAAWVSLLVGVALVAGMAFVALSLPSSVQVVDGAPLTWELKGAAQAQGRVEMAGGRVVVTAGSDEKTLLNGTFKLAAIESVEKDIEYTANGVDFSLKSKGFNTLYPMVGPSTQLVWDLKLSSSPEYDLNFDMAAGEQNLDFSGLKVKNLKVNTAVGRTIITLGVNPIHASVDTAIGMTTIYVPRGASVRINLGTAVTSVTLPSDYIRSGDTAYSPTLSANSTAVINLTLNQAVGVVNIRYK